MTDHERLLTAAETLLEILEDDEEVAYAEVGAVTADRTDVTVTHRGISNATPVSEAGVWCRAFADGGAEYRYTTELDEDSLEEHAEKVVRAASNLAQSQPASYDPASTVQATHPGWAGADSVTETSAEEAAEQLLTARDAALDDVDPERLRLGYRSHRFERDLLTTTGTTLHTVRDGDELELVLQLADAPKLRRHRGSTAGSEALSDAEELLSAAVTDASEHAAAATEQPDARSATVALAPRAAGRLVHHLSHYLETDTRYAGLSPLSPGDQVTSADLTVEDTVHAGSWAALAFDGEGRPTSPTTVVEDGVVSSCLHTTATAIDEGAFPAGNAVPSLDPEKPPRIHARHLDVEPGAAEDVSEGADLVVERLGQPSYVDELEGRQRAGWAPASELYTKDLDEMTTDREKVGEVRVPVREGWLLEDGDRVASVEGIELALSLGSWESLSAIGRHRETVTGVCEKHKSALPWAVTTPGLRLEAALRARA